MSIRDDGKTSRIIADLIDSFCDGLLMVDGKSKDTVTAYKSDVIQFASFIDELFKEGIESISDIGRKHMTEYAKKLNENGYAASSRSRKIKAVRSFFRWLMQDGAITEKQFNAIQSVKTPKIAIKEPRVITVQDQSDLIEVTRLGNHSTAQTYMRDYAIIVTFVSIGCRRAELSNILLENVNLNDSSIIFVGKGGNERKVYFSEGVQAILSEYIRVYRNQFGKSSSSPYLFVSRESGKMSLRTINYVVDKYMEATGVKEAGRSCHGLRKRYATSVYENTHDIYMVAKQLGQRGLSQVARYAFISDSEKRAAAVKI